MICQVGMVHVPIKNYLFQYSCTHFTPLNWNSNNLHVFTIQVGSRVTRQVGFSPPLPILEVLQVHPEAMEPGKG